MASHHFSVGRARCQGDSDRSTAVESPPTGAFVGSDAFDLRDRRKGPYRLHSLEGGRPSPSTQDPGYEEFEVGSLGQIRCDSSRESFIEREFREYDGVNPCDFTLGTVDQGSEIMEHSRRRLLLPPRLQPLLTTRTSLTTDPLRSNCLGLETGIEQSSDSTALEARITRFEAFAQKPTSHRLAISRHRCQVVGKTSKGAPSLRRACFRLDGRFRGWHLNTKRIRDANRILNSIKSSVVGECHTKGERKLLRVNNRKAHPDRDLISHRQ